MNTAIEELPIKLNSNYGHNLDKLNTKNTIELSNKAVVAQFTKYPSPLIYYHQLDKLLEVGYHETTRLIIKRLLNTYLTNKCF